MKRVIGTAAVTRFLPFGEGPRQDVLTKTLSGAKTVSILLIKVVAATAIVLGFSILALAIQLHLGIYIALKLPTQGLRSKFYIIIFAIPLLMPVIVVGYILMVLDVGDLLTYSTAQATVGATDCWNSPLYG